MRVLQLIDSLRPGGAERMAVSYANALSRRIDASHLCCSRMEGILRKNLSSEVGYLFLEKKSSLDLKAFFNLRKYIKQHEIDLIQAHSSSYFLAVLVKISLPDVKLIWHDHYGRNLEQRKPGLLKSFSRYFDGIISVNEKLSYWAKENLSCREISYFRNFLSGNSEVKSQVSLAGGEDFKIICVANLRPQKDHINLLKAVKLLGKEGDFSLHLIGKDEGDGYSEEVKNYIRKNLPEIKTFLYGEQEKVPAFLEQAHLGILSSSSEGLPVALLEYGRAGLPVVCTRVGQCAEVIGDKGKLVPPENPEKLAEAMRHYLNNEKQRRKDAAGFQEKVMREFSEKAVIPEVIEFFKSVMR